MGETWYFARDGRRMGPFSFEQLQQMAASGVLDADDMLLRLGAQQWSQARSVDGLFSGIVSDADVAAPTKPREALPSEVRPEQIGVVPSPPPSALAVANGDIASKLPQDVAPSVGSPASLPPIPAMVRAAGIIWIVFGALSLLLTLLMSSPLSAILVVLFAVAFIFVGAQTAGGWARDVIGNGIGSLVFGFSAISGGATMLPWGAILIGIGLPLFGAGVCALIGRNDYKKWRRAKERQELKD
jgi:hypothetical protein